MPLTMSAGYPPGRSLTFRKSLQQPNIHLNSCASGPLDRIRRNWQWIPRVTFMCLVRSTQCYFGASSRFTTYGAGPGTAGKLAAAVNAVDRPYDGPSLCQTSGSHCQDRTGGGMVRFEDDSEVFPICQTAGLSVVSFRGRSSLWSPSVVFACNPSLSAA